jgi:hypothetical protein
MPWYKRPKRRGRSPRLLAGLRHRDLLLRLSQPIRLSPDPILEASVVEPRSASFAFPLEQQPDVMKVMTEWSEVCQELIRPSLTN